MLGAPHTQSAASDSHGVMDVRATSSGALLEGRYVFEVTVSTTAGLKTSDKMSVVVVASKATVRSMPRMLLDMHAVWLDNTTRNCLPLIINEQGVSANSIHVEIGPSTPLAPHSGHDIAVLLIPPLSPCT